MIRPKRLTQGFTLLEVLIALSIFSLIGLASYRVLDIVILSQSKVSEHQQQMRALERAMYRISADFNQIVSRSIRDNYGDELPALTSNSEGYLLEFTRQGWRNPLQLPRSQLQRIAYELGQVEPPSANATKTRESHGGYQLLRHYWPALDRDQESKPQTQVLLGNLLDAELLFMDQKGNWQSQWPATSRYDEAEPSESLPTALMLKMHCAQLGQIERIYPLPSFNFSESNNTQQASNATTQGTSHEAS